MIRVLLVDDHRLFLAGLGALLARQEDVDVVGTAEDGTEAVRLVGALRPDVVLMDLAMPGMDGVDATRRALAAHPGCAVVVVSCMLGDDRVLEALEAGAVGVVAKDAEPSVLVEGIRAVARGGSPLDDRVARALLRDRREPSAPPALLRDRQAPPAPPVLQLTDREREVLALVAEGLANKQVARLLGITEATVKSHLGNVFQRTGVTSRTAAVLWAREHLRDAGGVRG